MKRVLVLALACFSALLLRNSAAEETVSLTAPETLPSNTQYRIERLTLQFDDPATPADEGSITISLRGQNGEARSCVYSSTTTPTATTLLTGLNKANLSTAFSGAGTGSLKQRIFHRLAVLGEGSSVCGISTTGTVTGTVP